MIIVILGIGLIILTIGLTITAKVGKELYSDDQEWIFYSLNGVGATISILAMIALVCLAAKYSQRLIIDDKIAIYETENAQIEHLIEKTVKIYMDYEKGTFETLKNEEIMALVSFYPELKADAVVQQQINQYIENRKELKGLQVQKLKFKIIAWWLYFGG